MNSAKEEKADAMYLIFPKELRPALYHAIFEDAENKEKFFVDPEAGPGPDSNFRIQMMKKDGSDSLSAILKPFGYAGDRRDEFYTLIMKHMDALNPPPSKGGRRRKSTTRVRVRGRPSTLTTRRATYGARRRATSARSVRARRPSK